MKKITRILKIWKIALASTFNYIEEIVRGIAIDFKELRNLYYGIICSNALIFNTK